MTPAVPVDPLAELRGWHLPEPVSWWPPAPGWFALVLLAMVLMLVAVWWALRRYRARGAARAAKRELQRLQDDFKTAGDVAAFSRGLSRLLRRFAIARYPRRQVAGLAGADWLDFLDAHGGNGRFRAGAGRVLAEAPYRLVEAVPAEDVAALVGDWIAQNAGKRP